MSAGRSAVPNRNTLWAHALVDGLARRGATRACIGSGSRSAPLVEALAADGRFLVHPHVDERCAAFFALGVGAESGRPAVVVTTSGTAAANLYPAIVEASQSEIPLIALTADRPASLRGTDANQTIDQVDLFGRYPRASIDVALPEPTRTGLARLGAAVEEAWQAALGPPSGPVHLNVQFEKPLEPVRVPGDVPADLEAYAPGRGAPDGDTAPPRPHAGAELVTLLRGARRPLIVCGPNHRPAIGDAALSLAARVRAPVLADPLSGARFGLGARRWTMGRADLFLRAAEVTGALRPDLVVRVGRAPTSAAVCRYLEHHRDVRQVVLDPAHRWRDHLATTPEPLTGDPVATLEYSAVAVSSPAETDWADRWRAADRAACAAVEPALAHGWFEGAIAAAVAETLPEGAPWFIGNSMPIRDVDAFARSSDRPLHTLGFRGASGIDGNVSGALGAAAASGRPAAALIGDLTLLHDVGALVADPPADVALHIVVIQNRGGGIFHMLPIRGYDPPFTPFVVMPQGIELEAVAAAAGIPHRPVASVAELREQLSAEPGSRGLRLTEARVDREHNWEQRTAAIESARQAACSAI
ncbi:2-succinyl-5-enolpyruvyl-6-hydroxy-3-cyclohexene-1-carboxylic-acid synthase [Candidatus Palauibacter sp.]|uniref:2-succinyl-5-enolpyruvyl-6-hydroxy-3- cyclohexene-1-carboxylic-acid synthase n=1 Tax=Candidatus Palauibacter sp. TaxID=3101350 RepID=UPI003AF2FF90